MVVKRADIIGMETLMGLRWSGGAGQAQNGQLEALPLYVRTANIKVNTVSTVGTN